MKKLIALVLVGIMLLGGAGMAASWPEGLGPSKPYSRYPQVDLTQTMGYLVLYPSTRLPVNGFCDVLEMYLPREDLMLLHGEGKLTVYEVIPGMEDQIFCVVNFADLNSVRIRKLSEKELESLIWGGGMCVEIHLPKSLEFGDRTHSYYVLMDEGCFAAGNGTLPSIGITAKDAWTPAISGDYGISGLCYADAPFQAKVLGTPEPTLAPNAGVNNTVPDNGAAQPDGQSDAATPAEDVQAEPEEVEISDPDTPMAALAESQSDEVYAPVVEGLDGQMIQSVGAGGLPGTEDSTGEFVGAEDGEGILFAEEGAGDFSVVDESLLNDDLAPAPTPTPAPLPPASYTEYVVRPDAGDIVHFDLVMGGDAAFAIPYSENGSVEFENVQFEESTHVVGTVIKDDVAWGVVFLNAEGDILNAFELGR